MDANGQIYFAPEDEIPRIDIERLRVAVKADLDERLERLLREETVRDQRATEYVRALPV